MSSFTLPFKRTIELTGANEGNSYTPIGLGVYPIFSEDYRSVLNKKIVEHYWNREIGQETIDMFSFAMRRKMNEIMPYYNKLYKTELEDYPMLSTMDISTVADTTSNEDSEALGNTTSTNENDSNSRSVSSNTPQTMLSGLEDYATAAADANSTSTGESEAIQENSQSTQNETHAQSRVSGYQGIPANLVIRFRESLLNIDLMVIAEIEECFMQVFDTADEYTTHGRLFI